MTNFLTTDTVVEDSYISLPTPFSNPYIIAATSDNTRRAYQADIRHFEQWGGKLPAYPEHIISYLQTYALELNPRTLGRRLTALKNWHTYQGFADPTSHPAVSKTLAGITRKLAKPKVKAQPLLPEELLLIIKILKQKNDLRSRRDNALLQIAFFGAFRRSEVVNLKLEHISWQERGIDILIPHSKTDQTNEGQFCAIPYGNEDCCPIRALKNWIAAAHITSGYLFRRISAQHALLTTPLTPLSVNLILKKWVIEAKLPFPEKYSSHSLRRGLATSASRDGATLSAIMRQGRWKNVNTVMEYIEAASRFEENAAGSILHKTK